MADINGEVVMGRVQKLSQKKATPSSESMFFDVGRPTGMTSAEYTPFLGQAGGLPIEKLYYFLESTSEPISIRNEGLFASYGVFGGPGSGKTHLLRLLLRQLFDLNKDDPDMKFGALILDPKAALMKDITQIATETDRLKDLVIINTDILNKAIETGGYNDAINVIHADLDPYELGYQLVLAAQAVGVATSDPYWILAWANLFGATTYLLSLGTFAVTLKDILEYVLTAEYRLNEAGIRVAERKIQVLARLIESKMNGLPSDRRHDAELAIGQINNFFSQENKELSTIENIIRRAYNDFLRSRYSCFSKIESKNNSHQRVPFYDRIIEEGKIVLVSLSPAEPNLAKTLCTLIKCLFQRSVLSRYERVQSGRLKNINRPVLIACDEYSQIASEVPGQPIGDGDFFSLARQQKCMGLLATQSVNVLQASSLKENWRSVFSTFGAKIFMRLADNETTEEASNLAGDSDWYLTTLGTSRSKEGLSSSSQRDMRERKTLPSNILTQVFQRGDAVVIGSLDGSKGSPLTFFHVPKDFAEVEEIMKERDANPK
jgi:hypothetical protein